ncbi:MAG: sterol desaturase family protein [Aquihabitans sp.]
MVTGGGLFISGVFAWSAGEYVIHRFLMHELRGYGLPSREHLEHHADPENNPGRPVLSWFGIVVVGGVLFGPAGWLAGAWLTGAGAVGLLVYAGWLVGYGCYERLHNRSHSHAPRNAYGRWVRRHHFHHHHGHPLANHGVTSPVWDWVFGTLEAPDLIRVPRRHAMPWLCDDAGAVKGEYRATYVLVGPPDASARLVGLDRARAFANLAPVAS